MWSRRAIWENSCTQRSCRKSEKPAGTDFSRNSRPYIVLKLSRDTHKACFSLVTAYTHALLVFHGSRLTATHGLFFIRHGLHPHNVCFSLVKAYIYAMLVFHWYSLHPHIACFSLAMVYTLAMLVLLWSQLTHTHCLFTGNHRVDFIFGRVYLSTTSAGSSQVNVIYYITSSYHLRKREWLSKEKNPSPIQL